MKKKLVFILSLLLCSISFAGYANTYYYISGTYTTASNWNTVSTGGGTAATTFTGSSDIWVIRTALTLSSTWTVAGELKIGDGTTTNTVIITTNPTITGGITVRTGATLDQNATSTASSPNMATTQDATSTIIYGSTTAHTIPAITYGNVTFSSSSASNLFSPGTTTIAGDFLQSAGTVTVASAASTSYTVNVSGDFSVGTSGAFIMSDNASGSATITVAGITTLSAAVGTILSFQTATATTGVSVFQANGNVSISGGTTNMIDWGKGVIGSNMFGVTGNLTISGAELINTSSTTTAAEGFVFNGSGTIQTLSNTSTGSAANTECTYQVTSGAYVQISANLSLGTGTTIHSAFKVLNGGTLDCSTHVISGGSTSGGGVIVSSGGIFVTANTGGINSSVTASGSTYNGGANYVFDGTAAQVTGTSMPAAIISPGSVTIDNSAGVTLSQATSFATGDTLELQTGTFTNGTDLTMSSGSYLMRDNGTLSATPSTYSGVNLIYNNLGTNTLAITTGNEFPASFTGSVTVNKTGATISLNGNKTITGGVTLTAGTLDVSASNYNINLTGNWTNNSGTTGLNDRSGTVTFNGSSAQTIGGTSATSFNDLTINNSAGVTLSTATTIASSDTLSLENGTFTNGSNLSMNSGSYLTRDNGTISATPTTYSGVNLTYGNLGNNAAAVTTGNEFPATFTGNVIVNKTGATITLNGSKTLAGLTLTAGTLDASTSNYNLSLTGNWTNNSGTTAFTERSGTVTLDGSSAQTIAGSAATSFNGLTISNTGAAIAVNTNINVSGTLNMNGAATQLVPAAAVVINSGGAAGTITGTGTIEATRIAATADYVNQYKFSTNTLTNITVDYAGAGAQTINSVGSYGGLQTAGSGTKTLSGAILIGGDITIGSGTTLDVTTSNYQITDSGNWTNNGTFTAQNGTVYMSGTDTGLILSGTMTGSNKFYNLVFLGGSSASWSFAATTVEVGNTFNMSTGTVTAPSSTLQVDGNWYNSATFNNNNGTVLFSNTITGILINGTLTGTSKFNNVTFNGSGGGWSFVTSADVGGNFTITAGTVTAPSATLQVAGSWSNSGTFTNNGGTVVMNGTGVNKLAGSMTGSNKFNVLTFDGSGGSWSFGSNAADVGSDFTITAGTVTVPSSTLQVAGNWSNSGTFTNNSGTVVMNATTTGKTLSGAMTGSNKFNVLTFNGGGGAWSFGSSAADVGSNFTITAGTVTAPSSILQVAGNWNNNGTFTHNSGTVGFNRTGTQTIGGSSATTFNNLTIGSGSVTTISTTGQTINSILQCNDTLNADGNLTLLSTSSQTALIDGSGTGQVLGKVTMQRYLSSDYGYKYVSSAFKADTVGVFSSYVTLADTFPDFYKFDESLSSGGWVIDTVADSSLHPLQGFAANFGGSTSALTFSLSGVVNNGSISSTLYNHNNTYTVGYNLVGNPYPSPIDWYASSGWTKTHIDDAVYYFNQGTTDRYSGTYSSYIGGISSDGVANNIIPAMQGFFVHVSNGTYPVTGVLGVTNSVRINNLTPVYHRLSGSSGPPLLRLEAGYVNGVTDRAVIYFNDTATGEFDKQLDALKLLNTDVNVPNLYALSQDTKTQYSIQAIPIPTDSSTNIIPLGLVTGKDGTIVINARDIDEMPVGLHIYLHDIKTGMVQDLRSTPSYSQYIGKGKYENRFFLVFTYKDVTTIPAFNDELNAYTTGSNLFVYLTYGDGDLVVTNIAGQIVLKQELSGNGYHEVNCPYPTGIYVATLYSNIGKQSKKIFLGNK